MDEVVVIVVPFPAHSHLNQLLQLSCIISSYNIPVHYVSSATHLRLAKHRFNHTRFPEITKIHFHEFPVPPFTSPPPNPNSSSRFPKHLLPSFEASLHLRQPVAKYLQEIGPTAKRVIIIHDTAIAYVVQDAASVPNAESYTFLPVSAFASFFDKWEMMGKPFPVKEEPQGLPTIENCYSFEIMNLLVLQSEFLESRSGIIYNSCRAIEGAYIDLVAKEEIRGNRQLWAIGPLNTSREQGSKNPESRHKCLEWLDKQAPNSVLFISFGTSTLMTDKQIKELAMGLEQSRQKFMWVLREADKGDIFEGEPKRVELPEGYEERVKEVGMVQRDWAPQLDILSHPSTGGFMSHCGWNSCLESITMGVPIIAWPMHSDQPKNAFMVTDVLKVGLAVKNWTQDEEIVTSSTIAEAVKRLMASKDGEDMKKKAEDLGKAIRQAVEEGGISRRELDSFIAHTTR